MHLSHMYLFALVLACNPVGESTAAGSDESSSGASELPEPDPTTGAPDTTGGEPATIATGSDSDVSEDSGSGGGGQCGDEAPAEGQPWGPCRDEDPNDPQWITRCDDGIFCTQMPEGTICLPPCAFPADDPSAGSCPCGAPAAAECAPLTSPERPDRPCYVSGECPADMAETLAGCVWAGQGLDGGPADPPPPDPSCGVWPPEAGQVWGPCDGNSCAPGSECKMGDNGTICAPACDGPQIIDCPGYGCFGYPSELFCTGEGATCEILCTWGPGDMEGNCPEGMTCDPDSRCVW